MSPWVLITVLLAGINLAAFLVVRGRWGRIVGLLAVASLAGTAAGDAVGAATRVEILRLGDYHTVTASVGAQLAMLATVLVAAMLPSPAETAEDGDPRRAR
jgi:hypothetical protein